MVQDVSAREAPHACMMMYDLLKKVQSFFEECKRLPSRDVEDVLGPACELLSQLQNVVVGMPDSHVVPSVVKRLSSRIDAKGKAWIQRLVQEKGAEAVEILTKRKALSKATPFLQDCLTTISMIHDDEVAIALKTEIDVAEASFASLAPLMPVYAKVCSIQQVFVTADQAVNFANFASKMEAAMTDVTEAMGQTVQQLRALAEKYRLELESFPTFVL